MSKETYVYRLFISSSVEELIQSTPETTRAKIISAFHAIRLNRFDSVYAKVLRGKIRELIIKRFRFIFFIETDTIYVVRGFIKKSNKTPTSEIEYAEKKYEEVLSINKENYERNKNWW